MSIAHSLPKKRYTAEDLERFSGGERYELIRGELIVPPMPGAEHGDLTIMLSSYATLFVAEHDLGRCFAAETLFTIEQKPDTVIGPDWAFVAKERLPAKLPKGFLALAPDIVLEVRSPTDRKREVEAKVRQWLDAGTRLVWELNPAKRILTVHRFGRESQALGIEDTLSGEDILPGFSLPLRRVFRDLEPE